MNQKQEQQTLTQLVEQALAHAKQQGATQAEVAASVDSGITTTVRLDEVENVTFHRDKGFGVTVYFGKRKGSASTSDTTPGSVLQTVQAACNIAKYTAEDPFAGLADPKLLAKDIPDLDLYYPWELSPETAIDLCKECERDALTIDKRITNSEGASISTGQGVKVYGNSEGFVGGYPSSKHHMSCVLIGEQDGNMQRDYWYDVARDSNDLDSPKLIAKHAVERTLNRLGAKKIKTGQFPVLFATECAPSLISAFLSAISGGHLYRKSTFLLDSLGKKVFSPIVTIYEDPLVKKGLASEPFDHEGVATKARELVKDGVLQGYLLSSYSARRLGMQSTGNAGGAHNMFLSTGEHNFDELIKKMDKGLVVTELMGQGVNLVTGDYSRGVSGFWVEHGQIQHPVEEITIAGNLRDMFNQILFIGNDIDKRSSIKTGSILIENMMVAGH